MGNATSKTDRETVVAMIARADDAASAFFANRDEESLRRAIAAYEAALERAEIADRGEGPLMEQLRAVSWRYISDAAGYSTARRDRADLPDPASRCTATT